MKNSNAEIAALVIVLLMGGAGVYTQRTHTEKNQPGKKQIPGLITIHNGCEYPQYLKKTAQISLLFGDNDD